MPPLFVMSDLKPTRIKVKLGKNEYGLRFTLNAIEDIQDKFNVPIKQLGDLFNDKDNQVKNLKYLLTVLINEDIDCENDESDDKKPHVDERYVGRHIDAQNMTNMMSAIYKSFSEGSPQSDENDEDEIPNVQSE